MEGENPKISVLMPAYNAEKFIEEAIESILAQTFTDFEFIIINDGSEDKTAEIIRAHTDPRIVFVDNERNQGLIAVLNQGLDMARGEYIARMDADDIAYPERFAAQAAFMDANPDIGMVSANVRIFGDKFGELGDTRNSITRHPAFMGALDWYLGCRASHPLAMLRKEIFDKYGLRYDPDYVACEDYELWSRAVRYMKIANMPEVLLDYRWHDANSSARQRVIQLENTKRVQDNVLAFCMHNEDDRLAYRSRAGENLDALYMKIRLFGFIPFITIKAKRNSRKVFLFNFIPLVKIKKHSVFLFFVLPLATIGNLSNDPWA